jgi:hypothetical protein|tara:strand:+ start:113 stop:637 length:525 start_codon:yes stop_codon:yes gene_type:complete
MDVMDIASLIRGNIEPNVIQTQIIETLERHNQKPLTKRHIDELKEKVDDSIYLSKRAGMTNIEWGGYNTSGGNQGGSLLISHQTKNVKVDTVDIVERNPAYFSALRERNQKRRETLANESKTLAIARLEGSVRAFVTARQQIKEALEFGGPFCPDRHAIQKMIDELKPVVRPNP